MQNKAARFRAVAEDEGLSVEQLRELVDNWKATQSELATRDGRAGARPVLRPAGAPEESRSENRSPPPGAENGVPDLSDVRLRAAYDQIKNIDLDDPEFSNDDRARWASLIKSTYEALNRSNLGIQLDQRLARKAFAILQRDRRSRLKSGMSMRRGRRPKGVQNSPQGPSRNESRRSRNEVRALPALADWQPPSVPLPNGLTWPTEQFDKSPEFQKRGGILRHLERVWRTLIAAGVVDMTLMRAFYPSTARAVDSFKYNDGKELRILPNHLDIPLLKAGSGRRRRAAALQT